MASMWRGARCGVGGRRGGSTSSLTMSPTREDGQRGCRWWFSRAGWGIWGVLGRDVARRRRLGTVGEVGLDAGLTWSRVGRFLRVRVCVRSMTWQWVSPPCRRCLAVGPVVSSLGPPCLHRPRVLSFGPPCCCSGPTSLSRGEGHRCGLRERWGG